MAILINVIFAIIILMIGIVFAWIAKNINEVGPSAGIVTLIFSIACSCALFYHAYTLTNPPTYKGVTVSGVELTNVNSCNKNNMTCTADGVTYSMESIQLETTKED